MGYTSPKGVKPERNKTKSRRRPPKYFELDGRVHKHLASNKAKDITYAWDYERNQRVTYNYTLAKKRMQPVFRTGEVAWMLNRARMTVSKAIMYGMVEKPLKAPYMPEDPNHDPNRALYLWTEKDILNLLDYFGSVHFGRPRKDEIVNPLRGLPTPREVKAMIHEENIMYVKQGDHFVPTWRAREI